MGKFFARNINGRGRLVRLIWGLGCIAGGIALSHRSMVACVVLSAAGLFAFFEAARGWCVMRACGIKTRL